MANEKPISKDYLLTQLKNYETEIINKKYIEKEDGKGLSSNDYTTEEKNKLAGLENYNDTALSNRVKSIEDEVPNLATKTYVGEQISNADHLKREIVTEIPKPETADKNTIYMLKIESVTGNDKYREYLLIDGTVQCVGDTSVDLTDYAKTTDVDKKLNNKADKSDIPTTVAELTDSADYAKKTDLHNHTNKTVLDGITSDKVTAWDTVNNKVDKVDGKGLSTEDYTTSEKTIVSKLGESSEGSLTYNGSEIKPSVATTESTGIVKPDGKSMSIDESGTLSINLDGTTITLDEAKNVIKLADTLKDKIGSALQPESIVNNQITTVEGFALDARQANPNIDGTLAKQLSDLNGSLNKADENTISNWMVGYSVSGAGFVVPIPSINNYDFNSKKIKIFTTSGWQDCTSQPEFFSRFGSGYNVFYGDGLPEGLEFGKAFLCQFI